MTSPSSSVTWFRHLARNHAWSNERLHAAVAQLSPEEYVAKRTSFFPSIHLTLWHIALVDDYYLDAMTGGGRARSIFDDWEAGGARGSHAEVRARQHALDVKHLAFVDSLESDADLARVVPVVRSTGVVEETVGDLLMHNGTHAIHHRGQAHAMLAGTRVAPPQLDEYFCVVPDRAIAEGELAAAGFSPVR
jgi:uncharacterized damage-inducible protein DinB